MKRPQTNVALVALSAAITLTGCATDAPTAGSASPKTAAAAEKLYRDSFRPDNKPEWMGRLDQDEAMQACSAYRDDPPQELRAKIEAAQLATVKHPADGKMIGDWKEGEKLASSGRGGHVGFIQPDPPGTATGGNCYACHQLAKAEVAYGTIGPPLQHYGKLRGTSEAIVKYTYGKIYNAQAYNLCTNMPRFGYHQWLTPEQIAHLTAFLLDPQSPVNKD
jgi:sulfur-oxidizing protein SoxX